MQRDRNELERMTHAQLVDRVLELQDLMREGLAVRESLHVILNRVLAANEDLVLKYADAEADALSGDDLERKQAWAEARMAVANPSGHAKKRS
jgi:hypothetical protein